ncbi:MAG: N-acetylmuramoyl-L-alanine amidase [Betaproteobacteria bacterium]|nr:N-acetylmuramoyl-L-alanine amidase [Betaproteobacteria bacterium]
MNPRSVVRSILPALAAATLAACAPMPRGSTEGAIWYPSPNFDQRRPNFVILHHTTNDNAARALRTLSDPRREVSAHYLIGRDGTTYQLVDEISRAWHAGESWWGGVADLNSASLGIELDNTGDEEFGEAQIDALLVLLGRLRARYRIPAANILGHGDIAPTRKIDPSHRFPWNRLAAGGFGLWCDSSSPDPAPEGFDSTLALQALGYDVSSPDAARQAFRRHFAASDENGELSADELARLLCLVRKKGRR